MDILGKIFISKRDFDSQPKFSFQKSHVLFGKLFLCNKLFQIKFKFSKLTSLDF